MTKDTIPSTAPPSNPPAPVADRPDMVKMIGGTTFDVYFRFSQTSRETFSDKVLRLIQNDIVTKR